MPTIKLVIGLLLAAALGVVLWLGRQPNEGAYDYAAAFEQIESPSKLDVIVDVPGIAGQPRAQVEQVLGRPQRCERSLYGERCRYPRVEIVYVDGKADWLTVLFAYGRYPLEAATLSAIGLPVTAPDSNAAYELRWATLGGYPLVQLVGDENGATFLRVKAGHA